jgi:hypothetical protein
MVQTILQIPFLCLNLDFVGFVGLEDTVTRSFISS